ncbi:endonuclease V isoform X2 [Anser cygnoides]|uniref:endonuclease V isoform X2 n=1 Tax=Anser cygnoides TaxID=8845 RepID=UPI0034D27388
MTGTFNRHFSAISLFLDTCQHRGARCAAALPLHSSPGAAGLAAPPFAPLSTPGAPRPRWKERKKRKLPQNEPAPFLPSPHPPAAAFRRAGGRPLPAALLNKAPLQLLPPPPPSPPRRHDGAAAGRPAPPLGTVLLVDGNGLLHHRGFGVACHLGVLTDLPCIGVAKNLLQVDGLARDELHREQIRSLQRGGDTFPLTGTSGNVLGMALRSCNSSKPLYISVGHRVCLETAVRLVQSCCRYRIPEPIRQATSVMLMLIQRSWKRSFPGAVSLAQTAVLLLWAFPRYCTPQGTAGSGTAGSQLTLDRGSIFGSRCVHQ